MKQQHQGGPEPRKHPQRHPEEQINYRSGDGLVEIVTTPGRKFPQHDYRIVVLRLRPQAGTRILQLEDGSGGVEVLLSHLEVAAHLRSLNQADPKGNYTWRDIPEKPKARKEHWKKINAQRHRRKRRR